MEDWVREFQMVFECVRHFFDINTTSEHCCATHIHMSPCDGFTIEQLRQVARGVYTFQDDISGLILGEGPYSVFSRPARLDAVPYHDISLLDQEGLIDAMNPGPSDNDTDFVDPKYVAWNFLSLLN
jgi:hypothetical protein